MVSMGIDYRRNAIAISVHNDTETVQFMITYNHDTVDGRADLFRKMVALMNTFKPDVVTIERQIINKWIASSRTMGEVSAACTLAIGFYRKGASIPVLYEVVPSSWKKRVLGSGKAGKPEAKQLSGASNYDLADAWCMARYGKMMLDEAA